MGTTVPDIEPEPARGDASVIVKTATTPLGRARLAHEADMLDVARHPGVVELLGFTDGDACASLTSARVRGSTLAERAVAMPVRAAAGAVAALAQTVADLHDLGVVHGRIGADRVVIRHDGQPVLCDFASARRRGVAAPSDSVEAPPLSPAADVADLGALLRRLVGHIEGSPIPEHRRRALSRARSEDDDRRTLLTLADHATHDDPAARPSAAQLSAAVLAAVPDACLPSTPIDVDERAPDPVAVVGIDGGRYGSARPGEVPRPLASPPRLRSPGMSSGSSSHRRRRVRRAVGGAVAAAVAGLGITAAPTMLAPTASQRVARPPNRPDHPSPTTTSPPVEPPVSGLDMPRTSAAPTTRPAPRHCQPASPPAWAETAADVDGDGCLDPVRVGDGAIGTVAHRYVVGSVGDPVVVGDWDCNGTATPATVHRANGQLFVFQEWAAPGRDVSVPVRAEVPADVTLASSDPDGHGCPVLEIHQPGQPTRVIDDRPPSGSGGPA